MADKKIISQITSTPGIRRDGTVVDSDHYNDGQWVRFQRGKPKKIGGYRSLSRELTGPIRRCLMWSRGVVNTLYSFNSYGIEALQVDKNGNGNSVVDVTPASFLYNQDNSWTVDSMYDAAAGSLGTIVVAVSTQTLTNIDDTTNRQVYYSVANAVNQFQPIAGLSVSGGIVCAPPYLIYYGNDGLVGWSDVNQPQTLTSGDAGTARVTGAKVVKALAAPSKNGPGAVLWSLDSVISMQYIGGNAVFRFSTLSPSSSILSANSVIEYDGIYYWVGVDRFMACDGNSVSELPNTENLNWFFDGLNQAYSQKVWAAKIPRYGEIWWFFPKDGATECSHAVIYNVREKTWYDCKLDRSSGFSSQVFKYPVMSGSSPRTDAIRANITLSSGSIKAGDTLSGATSGATATVIKAEGSNNYLIMVNSPTVSFTPGEGINNLSAAGAGTLVFIKNLYSAYIHEKGKNAVEGETELSILSFFETCDFGLPTGGTKNGLTEGIDTNTRIIRIEPDFVMSGNMQVQVVGRKRPQGADVFSDEYTFGPTTETVDLREQRRMIRLRFTSNAINGSYEMGKTLIHCEPGDPMP